MSLRMRLMVGDLELNLGVAIVAFAENKCHLLRADSKFSWHTIMRLDLIDESGRFCQEVCREERTPWSYSQASCLAGGDNSISNTCFDITRIGSPPAEASRPIDNQTVNGHSPKEPDRIKNLCMSRAYYSKDNTIITLFDFILIQFSALYIHGYVTKRQYKSQCNQRHTKNTT